MNTYITFKNASRTSISVLALLAIATLSGCWEKQPTKEEIDAQVKAAVAVALAEAEKTKQVPAAAPPLVAAAPKRVVKAKPVAKPVEEAPVQKAICTDCGTVLSVDIAEVEGTGSGIGVVAGGVTGGLLGHQIGDGTGKDLATMVGVVGGAIAGNKLEKTMKKTKVYDVTVKMENGEERTLRHVTQPGVVAGDKVRVENDFVIKQ